ncbi:MAG: hypothetical protein U0835_00590 [Isosphaeraceae bacterium]
MPKSPSYEDSKSFAQMGAKEYEPAVFALFEVPANSGRLLFRRRIGDRAFRKAFFTLVLMLALIPAVPTLAIFTPCWLFLFITSRVDRNAHSNWGGWSRLGFLGGEKVARLVTEPLAVAALGLACVGFDPAFTVFCATVAVCMFALASHGMHEVERTRRRLRDAESEARFLDQVRRGRW